MKKYLTILLSIILFQSQAYSNVLGFPAFILKNQQLFTINLITATPIYNTSNVNLNAALNTLYSYTNTKKENTFTGGKLDAVAKAQGANQGVKITSGGDINIVAGKDINSISTQFNAGNTNLAAGYIVNDLGALEKSGQKGSVNLLAAQDYNKTFEQHEKWGGVLDMATNIRLDFNNGLTLSASYNKTSDKSNIEIFTANVNEITSANGINIEATNNVLSIGSQMTAPGDVHVTADENIIMLAAQNSVKTDTKHEDTTITVGVKVGNAYVDAGLAAKGLVKGTGVLTT